MWQKRRRQKHEKKSKEREQKLAGTKRREKRNIGESAERIEGRAFFLKKMEREERRNRKVGGVRERERS